MEKGSGRLIAYLLALGQIIFAVFFLDEISRSLSSSIASQEQMVVIAVLSSFVFGITQDSLCFFFGMLSILALGGLVLKDYSNFLSSFVKIQMFFAVMSWILIVKYAPDIQPFENLPIFMLIIIHIALLILFSKGIEFTKKQFEDYRKEHSKIESTNKEPLDFACPHCGYVYQSIPMYCINCKKDITPAGDK